MAGIIKETTQERVLVIHSGGAVPDDLAEALAFQRLAAHPQTISRDAFWPIGSFAAAIVCSSELGDDVRAVAPRLKSSRSALPVLLWGGRSSGPLQEVFSAGYDAWLPMDAQPTVVAAQARVLCRLVAAAARPSEPDMVTVRNVSIDLQGPSVTVDSKNVMLTPTEYRIIAFLARRPGRVVSHADLFREVHGYDTAEQDAKDILKVHIWRLRNKLTAAGADPDLIANVRGFGYLLERRAPTREAVALRA